MKREILFRGKRRDTGEWIFGWLIQHENLKYYILWYDSLTFRWKKNEVIEETIGQFTGLADKNGVKIFEDDLISKGNVVEYSFGSFNINGDTPLNAILSRIEIIGNIHDNPELAK